MQLLLSAMFVLTLALGILQCGGTNANVASKVTSPAVEEESEDTAPRITLADAKKAFDAGTALFIDTRGEAQFAQSHIKGAINMPSETFEARYSEVPKDKMVIAYCS